MWKAFSELLDDGLDGQVWADDANAPKSTQPQAHDAKPVEPQRRGEERVTPMRAVDPYATAESFRVQKSQSEPDQDWEKIWDEVKATPSKGKADTREAEPTKDAKAPEATSPWASLLGAGLGALTGDSNTKAAAEEQPAATATQNAETAEASVPGALNSIGSWFTVESPQARVEKSEPVTAPETPQQQKEEEPAGTADVPSGVGVVASTTQDSLTTGLEELEALEASLGSIDIHQHDDDAPAGLISPEALDFDLDAFAEDLNLTRSMEGATKDG